MKTLKDHAEAYPIAEQQIFAWYEEVEAAAWKTPNELKQQFRNASVISEKRVVFNIKGNSFRLIADIEYRLQIVFVVWFGTHQQYDNIDAKNITYAKANKK